jgi:hypothetical protein
MSREYNYKSLYVTGSVSYEEFDKVMRSTSLFKNKELFMLLTDGSDVNSVFYRWARKNGVLCADFQPTFLPGYCLCFTESTESEHVKMIDSMFKEKDIVVHIHKTRPKKEEVPPMKLDKLDPTKKILAIVGDRFYADEDKLYSVICSSKAYKEGKLARIITVDGNAPLVFAIKRVAKTLGVEVVSMKPDWADIKGKPEKFIKVNKKGDLYYSGAAQDRDRKIFLTADYAIFAYDNKSHKMIESIMQYQLPTYFVTKDPTLQGVVDKYNGK